MLPGLIWYLVFRYFPMLGIVIAFEDYKPFWGIEGIFTSNWVGFKHFIKFFQSPYFFRLMEKYSPAEYLHSGMELSDSHYSGTFYQ